MFRAVPRLSALALALVLGVAALCGCGGSSSTSSGATAPASSGGKKLRIIMVSHVPSTDPFGVVFANGLTQAGADQGVSVEYRSTAQNAQDPNEQRRLIEAAIASRPDGLIVTDLFPQSLDPAIKQATQAGIPTVIVGAGIGETGRTGALTVIANDETRAGVLAGQRMKALGVTHPLVVTLPPGAAPIVDQRTNGFIKGFGGGPVEQAQIPLANLNDSVFTKNTVEAKLTKDPSIDGVFSLGSSLSPGIIQVEKDLGARAKRIQWSSIDLTPPVVTALQNHQWAFALDQQQFSQPYLAVTDLVLYIKYGITPPLVFTPTGPAAVTPENADRMAELEQKHVR